MLLELNQRSTAGLDVALLWDDQTGETFIELETASEWNRFQVPQDRASDAFNHPRLYEALASSDSPSKNAEKVL